MTDQLDPLAIATLDPAVEAPPFAPPAGGGEGLAAKPLTPSRLAWNRFRRHKLAMASVVVLLIIVIACVFANLFTKYGITETGTGPAFVGPRRGHWMGTDQIGRDGWTAVLYGGRISLAVGVGVALFATIIGTIIGALAGYYGGWLDNALMRVTDLFLAMPLLVILILGSRFPQRNAWARTVMGEAHSMRAIITILALFFWMPIARVVRGLFLSLKEKEFVEAARAAGASNTRIMARHLVPNCIGQIIINATLAVAAAILIEAALSFLGYGVEPG